MFIGPVFTREMTTAPRREWTYIVRSVYAGLLLLLIVTAWLVVSGTQLITDTGDFARFGTMLFQFLAPVQLVLAVFFAAVIAAGTVGQEKERGTLTLLLMTRMTNSELVLGKLFAGLLNILSMLAVSIPIFTAMAMLGGVGYDQILQVMLVTLFSMLACGSLGSCVALRQEKTFQAIAVTILLIVLWIGLWESLPAAKPLSAVFSPWSAIVAASRPAADMTAPAAAVSGLMIPFLTACGSLVIFINLIAVLFVRNWNMKNGEARIKEEPKDGEAKPLSQTSGNHLPHFPCFRFQRSRTRHVWNNPVIWREMMTAAYGRRIWIIQFGFLAFFAMCFWTLHNIVAENTIVTAAQLAAPMVPLFLLSLVLVNAQAITSQTSEKDGGTFDLILASDITPKEYVFGKLGGVFYNMKWIVMFPLTLCGYLYWYEALDSMSLFFLLIGLIVLYAFAAMVGVYIGMQYDNTRTATATSLGIMFFLFVGIAACIWIMIAFSGSFETQLVPFSAFMVGGGIGLYVTLGARNPSSAIATASFSLPIAVFYVITSMLLGKYLLVFVVLCGAFGFTTAAMLIPSIAEFDVAAGRTTAD
ncbi:MAG: ABC transporter permease [Planctomycetaceae bacterium]|jgi:ABC-type transport system involved in multi-copper enzyme maturation permease subunit|nr:ABC transporter permease [Planctomycetaceae bacterium]